MTFCCHCGKPVDGGRYCAACGGPIAPEAVAESAAKLHRNRMRILGVTLVLLFVIAAGFIVNRILHTHAAAPALSGGAPLASLPPPQLAPSTEPAAVQSSPGQVVASGGFSSQPQPAQPGAPIQDNSASRHPAGSIDPKAVQEALTMMAENNSHAAQPMQPPPASSGPSTGSDRYPGSQPLEVKDVSLPDIGVPVVSELYTTADPLPTVLAYYTGRYPDAEVMEVNGQKIIAVNRPGATKVIALGTTGQETRIAILQPAN
jgi:hypothetical protein